MKILAVHGYSFGSPTNVAYLQNVAVCKAVANVHTQYELILLLGGLTHSNQLRPTSSDVQSRILSELGVLNVGTQFTLGLEGFLPARDTLEEIYLLGMMFQRLGLKPRDDTFDIALLSIHVGRSKALYRNIGARTGEWVIASGDSIPKRHLDEV